MCSFKFRISLVIIIIISTLLIPPLLYPQVFTFGSSYPTGDTPECVVAADFDGDTDIDIAVGHRKDTRIIIYGNDGDANFTPVDSLSAFFMRALFAADLNGDGISDLMACQEYGNTVRFWYSNGDGTFDLGLEEQFGHWPEQLCAADFNGDMIMDVAYNNIFDGSGISIKFGKGNGLFDTSTVIVPGVTGSNIGMGDFDNDGDMDIVFDGVYSILNDGDGTFGDTLKALGSLNAFKVTEINGDEYPDLVGIGTYGCAGSPVYMLGTESGIFSERQMAWTVAGWLRTNSPLCADFNNDGHTDIAISARDGYGMKCGFNDGLTIFRTSERIQYPDTGSLGMAAGDFDGDGDIDIAVTSYDDSLIIIHSLAAAHVRRMQVPVDFSTIREAVDYAWNLDTIIVEPGIYVEHIDFGGKNIVLMSSEYVDGKMFKGLSSFYTISSSTILDGGDTNRVITFDNGEDYRSVIAGFTIQNGNAAGYGGGIFCYDTAAPTIVYNIFMNNYAGSAGGAICVGKGKVGVKNNLFVENSSGLWGGGIFIGGSIGDFVNNTFYGNKAVSGGGGLYLNYGNPLISSNIFWNNSSTSNGQEIHYLSAPPDITYSDIRGGWPGEGNIDIYPMFADTANGDFHLIAGSPCINAGDPNLPLDPDSTTADIGAYFFFNPVNVFIEDLNKSQIPSSFYLTQNYPNPFNPQTSIEYGLPRGGYVSVDILNILGQSVKSLVDREQPAGLYRIVWDGNNFNGVPLSSGVYLYRIITGDFVQTKKMLLMK